MLRHWLVQITVDRHNLDRFTIRKWERWRTQMRRLAHERKTSDSDLAIHVNFPGSLPGGLE